ncbi:hypothetical protein L3X38_008878 [Prunus dulcis]|uniref:DUF4216 domain-containing protein n=1 Tax=Prunus dulcis TaxID=3755 RepID=A0AAD5F7J4_PRUDU|nr:hypothetical protein L3X38_008878 [Prunus dulcis]
MVSQQQTKDSGSKKLGIVAPQDKSSKEMKSSKKMKFASSSAETESQTTISDDSKTGRGMSTMPRVVKRKLQKVRPIVEYNKMGKGIGQAHIEMQSYIGVLARSRVPLVDKKWSQIPKDVKEQIWEAVDMAFVVGQGGKKSVLASAAKKWKDFKSTLTRHYILPYTNDKEKLSHPPETYKFIEKAQWDAFIAERYIAEEAVEFCTQHLSDVSTVGVPSSQKMGVSKPLSGCTVSVVDQDLLNQAHLYVLENTEEVLPYIEQHMIHIKTAYPKFRKSTKWLQDKHNSTFIQWLRFKVQSELEEDNNGVPENLRWLAAGPNMAVPLYRSYLIKGIKFNIKAQDDVRTTQNSGVYLLAQTMQVASAKDKNPILSNMGFYGVIQEIWDLDYQNFTIPVFRCDWIDSSGLVVDELGFTLVDLSKIGHRNDQFVLASQVKQIFFVDDPMHRGWSVVLSMPNREYNDVIGDEVLGDVIIECEPFTRGMPNVDTFDELVGELGGQNIRDGCEDIWIE